MKCIYCDQEKRKESLKSLFLEEDLLCEKCRKELVIKREVSDLEGLKVETFYEYDGLFRSLLLQYKECYDEALKDVFLYDLHLYLRLHYAGYAIAYVPSTKKKREERGFHHLRGIYGSLGLKEAEGLFFREERTQEGRDRSEREKMKGNMIYAGKRYKKILIADDVMTTGSSLSGAYRALKPYAEEVRAVCLSRAVKKKTLSN